MPSSFSLASAAIFFGALVAEFLILAHAQRIGSALGVMDHPDHIRKRHPHATPLVGGLAIMAVLLIWTTAMFILGKANNDRLAQAILLCGAGATILGHSDDQSSTSPSSRLLSLFLLTMIALVIAPTLLPTRLVLGFAPPLSLIPWVAYVLITIAMAGFVNAVNMADGQNGVVTGMFVIWSVCLIIVTGDFVRDVSCVLFIAAVFAFLFNIAGKVFLGDAGTYGVTFVFGLLAIRAQDSWGVSAVTITVWFFIPVMDCVRLMISRAVNGRAPSDGDRNHFHHRLQARVGRSKGLIIYLTAVGMPSLTAALFPQLSMLCLLVLFALYISLAWVDPAPFQKGQQLSLRHGEKERRVVANGRLGLIEAREQGADAG